MIDSKYIDFFDEIKKVKEKQEQQKRRGLNDYNLLTTVLKAHDEVRVHSRIIASLLDIEGKHYQDTLFLDKFLEIIKVTEYQSPYSKIQLEYQNIDLYLNDGEKHIIIENKIWAEDQNRQIERYIDIVKGENRELQPENLYLIYLSIDRKEPSAYSLGRFRVQGEYIVDDKNHKIAFYRAIHYKNEVPIWLQRSQYEIQNITNLNESIKQYMDVVSMITNQFRGKIMQLKDILLEDENYFQLAKEISQAYIQAETKKIEQFKEQLICNIKEYLFEVEYNVLDWKAIDIVGRYHLRIIALETDYILQVTHHKKSFEKIDKEEKEQILIALRRVDKNFKSGWDKVYGVLNIDHKSISKIKSLIEQIETIKLPKEYKS